jgi:hypothetical protein
MSRLIVNLASTLLFAVGLALAASTANAESVMKQCGEQWQAAKQAGTTNGETWSQFLKQCREQAKTAGGTGGGAAPTSQGGGFAPAAPAPAPAPAPTQQGSLFPWQQPAAPATAPATYENAPGASGYASPQQAQYRCGSGTVVWVNEKSHIYHFPGTRDYGHTKVGSYMCEADAQAAGNRAAKNERHP